MLLKHIYIFDNSKGDQIKIHIKRMDSDIDNSTIWAASHSPTSIAIWNSSSNAKILSNKDSSAHFHKSFFVKIRITGPVLWKNMPKYSSATSGFKSSTKLYDPF